MTGFLTSRTEARFPHPEKRPRKPRKPLRRKATLGAKRGAAKAAGWVDPDSWQDVIRFFAGECAYCTLPWQEQGHVVALARGGAHHISNVVPICRWHNQIHGTRTVWPRRRHPFMEAAK